MDAQQLWSAIDTQRLRTADLLASLTPEEWAHVSLCDGWTVRDVAAHLTLQQLSLKDALFIALRHPGSLNHMIRESARSRAALPTEQLVAEIRDMVGSRRHNAGVTALETLLDIVVHGQDIALPLGRRLDVPPEVAAAVAGRVWSYQTSRLSRRKTQVFRDVNAGSYRLTATDLAWSAGEGAEIRGPVLALLLLLTGRTSELSGLSGEGAADLARRLDGAR